MVTFIHVMEQTRRPTISLVLPMVGKMLTLLDSSRTIIVHDYELDCDSEVKVSSLVPLQLIHTAHLTNNLLNA
jgi:hypothetical protein